MPPFIQNLLALPAKTKALLGVSAVAILAIAFIMLKIATAPSYAQIASGLDPAADRQDHRGAGRPGDRLRAAQQRHGARRHEGAVGAGADRARRRRRADLRRLAARLRAARRVQARRLPVPAAGSPYQRALEGEVARTLAGVEGVQTPTVRLVLPQDDLFQDEATAATAAVMLGNPSDTLQPGAVRGMAQVVASSVKGLKSENVTITDSTGQVLWPSDEAARLDVGRRHQAERRGALRPPDGVLAERDARGHARPEQGDGEGQRGPQRGRHHREGTDLRRQGHAAQADARRPRSSRAARRPPAAPPARAPTSRRTRRARPAAAPTRTTTARRPRPTTASTRRSRRPRSPRAR